MRGTASIWRLLLSLSSSACVAIRAICVGSKACLPNERQGNNRLKEFLEVRGCELAVAGHMKQKMLCYNSWLAEGLCMGTKYLVIRYVSEIQNGNRVRARKLFERLTANLNV